VSGDSEGESEESEVKRMKERVERVKESERKREWRGLRE
jgi:hypothetical protein